MRKTAQPIQNRSGMAMILVLCAGAIFLSLTAAVLYSGTTVIAAANRRMLREQSYQLAKTFSAVIKADLCNPTKEDLTNKTSIYAYANNFLNGLFNTYDPDNIDQTVYSYGTTKSSGGGDADKFGDIQVSLYKEEGGTADANTDVGAQTLVMTIREGSTDISPDDAAARAAFEASKWSDYVFHVDVTSTFRGEKCTYIERYYRKVQYEVQYNLAGSTIYNGVIYFKDDAWYRGADGKNQVALASGNTITATYLVANPVEITFEPEEGVTP